MKIKICFKQNGNVTGYLATLTKVIELPIVPTPGMLFEYEEGWGLKMVDDRMQVLVCRDEVSIEGYGPQFSAEEIASLKKLGWEESP